MGGGHTTKRKGRSSAISQSSSFLGVVPKRYKPSSPERSNSKLKDTNIDDLPDVVLVDILSRLPCYHFLFKCKSVCKRWSIITSDPYFIGRFLFRLQSQGTPIPRLTQINQNGENFPVATNPSPLKILTKMFLRLMFSHSLKREPVVIGACNDLVLCCASEYFQRDYYICNPYTTQWVALPPVSRVLRNPPVGFVCDPYYKYPKKDKQEVHKPRSSIIQDQLVNINEDFKCMVVRIIPYDDTYEDELSYKFKVEIFSFEIGEWRESIISFPQKLRLEDINTCVHFAHSEMLYWLCTRVKYNFLIGLNPFKISNITNSNIVRTCDSSNSNSGENHQDFYVGRYIKLIVKGSHFELYRSYLHNCQIVGGVVPGVDGGTCLQICLLGSNHSAFIWELKKEDDLKIAADGTGKLYSKHLSLHLAKEIQLICLNPNQEGCLYIRVNGSHFKLINLRRKLSYEMNIPEKGRIISNYSFFPLKQQPWWPTPVPKLPHRSP